MKLRTAAKKLGNALGFEGRVGGWIYHGSSSNAICQGWMDFGIRMTNRGYLKIEDGEFVLTDKAKKEIESRERNYGTC